MAKKEEKAVIEPTIEAVVKTAKVVSGAGKKKNEYHMVLAYDRVETDENGVVVITPVNEEPPRFPHPDMFNVLKLLVPHWVIDFEEKEIKDFNKKYFEENKAADDDGLKNYRVTGVHVKEKSDQRFVTLVGRKILKSGRVINHSPSFNIDSEDSGYIFNDFLKRDYELFIGQVEQYMGGKKAPNPQLEMQGKGFTPESAADVEKAS